MRIFIQFHETYFELIVRICDSLKNQLKPEYVEFTGISLRRKTVCSKVDKVADSLGIVSCDWLNDIEKQILSGSLDSARLEFYRKALGDAKLREIISAGRQLGFGFVTGGKFARTKLREMFEKNPDLRWQYVVGLLDYFYERFSEDQPDFVFFHEITFPWEMAAYQVAGLLNISFFAMCYTRSGKGYIAVDNPYEDCSLISRTYVAGQADNSSIEPELLAKAEEILTAFRTQPEYPEYSVELNKKMRRQASVIGMFRMLVTDLMKYAATRVGLLGTRGVLRFENWLDMTRWNWQSAIEVRKALGRSTLFESVEAHIHSKYLYYPLHVEPEATTAILSSHMSNQLFLVEQISKSMPAGWKLLVKEHKPMLGRRPNGFYKHLKAFPDVHLISPFADNFSLIKHAHVVCVLSGTAGWEAIMLGIPAIVVGRAQYLGIGDGFIQCANLFDLGRYITEAAEMKPVPDDCIIRYIAATLQAQTSLTPRSVAYWHYGLKPDEVIDQAGVEEMACQLIALYKDKAPTG